MTNLMDKDLQRAIGLPDELPEDEIEKLLEIAKTGMLSSYECEALGGAYWRLQCELSLAKRMLDYADYLLTGRDKLDGAFDVEVTL